MLKKFITLCLLGSLALQCDVFDNIGMFDTKDFWKAVSPRVIRGSHRELCSSTMFAVEKNLSNLATMDFSAQTNYGLSTNRKLFEDVFDVGHIKNAWEPALQALELSEKANKFIGLLKALDLERVTACGMIKFARTFNDVRFGVDVPLVYERPFPYIQDQKAEDEIRAVFGSLKNEEDSIDPSPIDHFVSKESIEEIKNLFQDLVKIKGVGLGDLRFYFEKDVCDPSSAMGLLVGGELFIPTARPSVFIAPGLAPGRKNRLTQAYLRSVLKDLSSVNPPEIGESVLSWIENFTVTLLTGVLKPQIDESRTGIGLFARPVLESKSGLARLFGNFRANYLFSTDKAPVFTTKNDFSLESISFNAKINPVLIVQASVGTQFAYEKVFLTIGYDFFWKSAERINQVLHPIDGDENNLASSLVFENSETKASGQSAAFAGIGYKSESLYFGVNGNYAFQSTGSITDSWGLSFSLGYCF